MIKVKSYQEEQQVLAVNIKEILQKQLREQDTSLYYHIHKISNYYINSYNLKISYSYFFYLLISLKLKVLI